MDRIDFLDRMNIKPINCYLDGFRGPTRGRIVAKIITAGRMQWVFERWGDKGNFTLVDDYGVQRNLFSTTKIIGGKVVVTRPEGFVGTVLNAPTVKVTKAFQ